MSTTEMENEQIMQEFNNSKKKDKKKIINVLNIKFFFFLL